MIAFRLGSAHLKKLGVSMDAHTDGHNHAGHAHGHAGEGTDALTTTTLAADQKTRDLEKDTSSSINSDFHDSSEELPVQAQILGVAMLEFGKSLLGFML